MPPQEGCWDSADNWHVTQTCNVSPQPLDAATGEMPPQERCWDSADNWHVTQTCNVKPQPLDAATGGVLGLCRQLMPPQERCWDSADNWHVTQTCNVSPQPLDAATGEMPPQERCWDSADNWHVTQTCNVSPQPLDAATGEMPPQERCWDSADNWHVTQTCNVSPQPLDAATGEFLERKRQQPCARACALQFRTRRFCFGQRQTASAHRRRKSAKDGFHPQPAPGGSTMEAERQPLLVPSHADRARGPPVISRVFGRRWLVLALFSALALLQGMVWNFWGPIQNSAVRAFGFSKSDIAVLVLWGPVGFVPWLLFMWLMDKRGLRASLLLSAFFMLLGAVLRSIPLSDPPLRRWFIHGGQLLNGLAGPTIMCAGPFLSTTWFAPDQRATATAVASLFSYLGGAVAYVAGPLVVPAPNGTTAMTGSAWEQSMQDKIQLLLYAELAAIAVLFAAVLLYFPSRPPLPPSVAAASQRLSYRSSMCRLLSNLRFVMIALAYAVPTGVIAGWEGVLDMVLTPARVSQVDAGWIGFWSMVGGCVFGVAMARFADSIRGMLKVILVLMLAGASLSSTWFTLTCLSSYTHLPSTAGTPLLHTCLTHLSYTPV
ncbi:solute carrier family 49 member 4 [Nerophis ophidion]|uniref:solute carrier family 49 member 4 n=1 Tax=Nerophis ophidion TaxID=159077 RepID=UPI002AE0AC32|nr:solute carrier family 49 member 4 [Nerophis ophidion]